MLSVKVPKDKSTVVFHLLIISILYLLKVRVAQTVDLLLVR